jgi:superfamily I DNA/RNA helicase
MDIEQQRKEDTEKILNSNSKQRVVIGGPGTGKSYLFKEAIQKKVNEGKTNFLAITFVGRLADNLADDLAGLANTRTLHGFALSILKKDKKLNDWNFYPKMFEIIEEDLEILGVSDWSVADPDYKKRSLFYKAFGNDDVVSYVVKYLKNNPEKIPQYDLILIDEFQDFTEIEAKFIEILASKNEIIIVGDDDQALYIFRDASPKHIREKFLSEEKDVSKHILRFCSRCPETLTKAFHTITNSDDFNALETSRLNKEYLCYLPDKEKDTRLNPKILIHKDVPPAAIANVVRRELEKILEQQKVKSVLIIGEPTTTRETQKQTLNLLKRYGFKNVQLIKKTNFFKLDNYAAYKLITEDKNSNLGWRILSDQLKDDLTDQLKEVLLSSDKLVVDVLPEGFVSNHRSKIKIFKVLKGNNKSRIRSITDEDIDLLEEAIVKEKIQKRNIIKREINRENDIIGRPLQNLEISIGSILGAKGLSADVVFLIGFDQGRFPIEETPELAEFYQMIVALTRARKRLYCINTINRELSKFVDYFGEDNFEIVN